MVKREGVGAGAVRGWMVFPPLGAARVGGSPVLLSPLHSLGV